MASPFVRNERGCRCDADDEHCGRCLVCGRPGHDRPFPGPIPFRGRWCDRHARQIQLYHPLGAEGVLWWTLGGWTLVGLCLLVGLS